MKDKTVVITGASKGIGAELARQLAARGASFGSRFGWERPNFFRANGTAANDTPSFEGRPGWHEAVAREHRATREGVTLFDQSSFSTYEIAGRGTTKALQFLAANDIDKPLGALVYTQLCNARGGIEADLDVGRRHPGLDLDVLRRRLREVRVTRREAVAARGERVDAELPLAVADRTALVGRGREVEEVEVLVEGPSEHAKKELGDQLAETNGPLQLVGRTPCDRIVVFEGNQRLTGQIVPLMIYEIAPHTLFGAVATTHVSSSPLTMLGA